MSKKEDIYIFIKNYIDYYGYPPSIREIASGVELKSSNTVHYHLKALISEGRLQKEPFESRTIRISEKKKMGVQQLPILGNVAAGQPITAMENYEGEFPVPFSITKGHAAFGLKVKGDSMIDVGIFEGDIVIVEKTSTAENYSIIVALIDDEATVKRLVKGVNGYFLKAENVLYPPIEDPFTIIGKVIGVYKSF